MLPADDVFPAPEEDEETLSVRQVGERIQGLLKSGFPRPFWMTGEASGLERTRGGRSPHWYFTLVDDGGQGDGRPSLNVKMWATTVRKLFGPRGRLRKTIDPMDGMVLRVLVRPDFWLPRGEISFVIEDVDPEFTLGSLDRNRRELLARLSGEGALQWNKDVALADVPLQLGLVTSEGSAAHHDVMETLSAAGVRFSVAFCDARTQGGETGSSVCAALRALAGAGVDAILLVRGGGSRLDLSGFDREDIARAIAGSPVPVLTGIGHEIDSSVADAVSHLAFKTPTAVAEFLVDRARQAAAHIDGTFARILDLTSRALAAGGDALLDAGRELRRAASSHVDEASLDLRRRALALRSMADANLARAQEHVATASARLTAGPHVARLDWLADALGADVVRLARLGEQQLVREGRAVDVAERRCRLLDPVNVLARGFAWLRRTDGSILMDAGSARVDEPLTAVLRDGELDVVAGRARTTDSSQTAAGS